jgi:hypothetical protein
MIVVQQALLVNKKIPIKAGTTVLPIPIFSQRVKPIFVLICSLACL